jgi:hypothetical protein
MALEDYMEPEVGIAVAVTAAVASPQVRNVLRRGAVYGLAGLLMAGDAASSLAQGVKRGVQKTTSSEAAAPEILSADGPAAAPEAPVAAGKYASVAAEETAPAAETGEKADAASTGHKRTRKAAEASDHE